MIVHNPHPIVAARGKRPTALVKYWLADTGCGYDLASRKHVLKLTERIKSIDNPITFNTANGNTDASEDIMLRVDELDEDIEPYVLNSTPAVPSVGRRCMDYGYEFRWPSGESPLFTSPKGKKVKLEVNDYVLENKACQA